MAFHTIYQIITRWHKSLLLLDHPLPCSPRIKAVKMPFIVRRGRCKKGGNDIWYRLSCIFEGNDNNEIKDTRTIHVSYNNSIPSFS